MTAQEDLMVVQPTADRIPSGVSAMRSLDGKDSLSFHTYSLPEYGYVRLHVKILGKGMPERVVREELESLSIRTQGVTQLKSGGHDQDHAKDCPHTRQFMVPVQSLTDI
jgi:hypothetical protein